MLATNFDDSFRRTFLRHDRARRGGCMKDESDVR